jgi:iron complex outermembrane receptor protein
MLPDNLMNEFPTPISPGRKRNINSLVFQDEFAFNDSQTLTAGIRHDDYDDIGSNLSPRLALVWRITDEEILKFQYSEAFRPPSLLETDGAIDNSINPEIIRMLETSYIINNADYLIRNTLYYADIEDLIVYHSIAPFGYENLQHAKIYGYEIELTKTFGSDLKLSTNLGLQGSSNISSRLYRPSRWLASAAVDYRIAPHESANLLIHGNSELDRLSSDEREPLQQSPQVDLTYLKNRFLGSKSLQLSIGLKNIFGEEIRYAAPEQTYPDDYLYSQDPSLWLELDYGLSG